MLPAVKYSVIRNRSRLVLSYTNAELLELYHRGQMENSATTPFMGAVSHAGKECVYILYFPVSISKGHHVSKRRAVCRRQGHTFADSVGASFAGFVFRRSLWTFYDKGNEEADGRR